MSLTIRAGKASAGVIEPEAVEPMVRQIPRGFNNGGLHELSPTISSNSWECNNFIQEPLPCASRGRNPNNPKSRKSGEHTEQRLEINENGISNCLTSVQKDSLVIEPYTYSGRIRKLTPRECWRLMDFDDEDFEKAKAAGVSNSQLYKQAGNSICVKVLEAILKQMVVDASI